MSNDEHLFDVRVVRHHIRRGETTDDAYQKYLDSLSDEAEEGAPTDTVFVAHSEGRPGTDEDSA